MKNLNRNIKMSSKQSVFPREEPDTKNIDIPKLVPFDKATVSLASFSGFTPAFGKAIDISEEAKQKSKKLLENINKNVTENSVNSSNKEIPHDKFKHSFNAKPSGFLGFQSAAGKQITVSNEAQDRGKVLLKKFNDENIAKNNTSSQKNDSFQTSFDSQIASGKKVNTSKQSQINGKSFIDGWDKALPSKNNDAGPFAFLGFQTASGSKINVSKEAQDKAKTLLDNLNKAPSSSNKDKEPTSSFSQSLADSKSNIREKDVSLEDSLSSKNTSFGFQSALGKKITVSDEAQKKANSLLESLVETPLSTTISKEPHTSVGFQSASGKKIAVSEEAQKKAMSFLKNFESDLCSEPSFSDKTNKNSMGKRKIKESEKLKENPTLVFDTSRKNSSWLMALTNESNSTEEKQHVIKNSLYNSEISVANALDKSKGDLEDSFVNIISGNLPNVTAHKEMDDMNSFDFLNTSWDSEEEEIQPTPSFNYRALSPGNSVKLTTPMHSSTPVKSRLLQLVDNCNKRRPATDNNSSVVLEESLRHKSYTTVRAVPGQLMRARDVREPLQRVLTPLVSVLRPPDPSSFANLGDIGSFTVDFHHCLQMRFQMRLGMNSQLSSVGDGAVLVPDEGGYVDITALADSFLGMPHVDPGLISRAWVNNHIQLILWKLLCQRAADPWGVLAADWVSPHHLLLQLKYRYDREIDRAQRPSLRRIAELDDSPAKRMVLVVVSVTRTNNDVTKVLISDGWYVVPAMMDRSLRDRMKVGTKLVTVGAGWLANEPCQLPLESVSEGAALQMHCNGTRRARWYAKLGYQFANLGPWAMPLSSLIGGGGVAGLVTVILARVYPIQYMEKMSDPDSDKPKKHFSGQRVEDHVQKNYERHKEIVSEKFLGLITKSKITCKKTQSSVDDLNSGEDLLQFLTTCSDPDSAQAHMNQSQRDCLQNHTDWLLQKHLELHCPKREVKSLLRILVYGTHVADVDNKAAAVLAIWSPSDDLISLLKEGKPLKLYSVQVGHAHQNIHSSIYKCRVALSSTFGTRYEIDKSLHENLVARLCVDRQTLSVSATVKFISQTDGPVELDCVGLVVAVSQERESVSGDGWQHVVLMPDDLETLEPDKPVDMVLIKIWGGISKIHLSSYLEPGNCVRFANVHSRKSISTSPQSMHLRKTEAASSNPTPQPPPELHFGDHSDVGYVSRKWNFHSLRSGILERLAVLLPSMRLQQLTRTAVTPIRRSVAGVSAPPTGRKSGTGNLDKSPVVSSRKVSGSGAATPRRLGMGLSRRKLARSPVTPSSPAHPEAAVATGEGRLFDDDLNSSIADLVKTRKRCATLSLTSFSPVRKKNG